MPDTKEKSKEEEEDIVTTAIGAFGKWQLLLTFLLSLCNLPCTWHIFSPTFISKERDFWCARTPHFRSTDLRLWRNYTQPKGPCSIFDFNSTNLTHYDYQDPLNPIAKHEVACTQWEFAGEGITIISEFSLICDRKQLNNMAQMVFLGGVAIGGIVCGIISDKYGRKRTLMASILIQATLGTAIAFVPWFELYVILRAALGFISVSVVFSGFVLCIELVDGKWRTISGISYLFPVPLGYISIAGIAWLIRDWRHLQLAISLPGFLFFSYCWILPESPRWLLARGKTQEVMVILQKAALKNGIELPHNLDKQLLPTAQEIDSDVRVSDLFQTARMRKTTFLLSIIWFTLYLIYYGLVLNLENIGGDIYVNSVLSGVVEIPAIAISILILLKMGRRWPLALTIMLSGVACILTMPVSYFSPKTQWLITSFAMIGKFSISSSNVVIPVFTAELYPTTIRNIGVGAGNVTAGIALLLIPYLWELVVFHQSVPMGILGLFGFIGGVSVLFLPETANAPLPYNLRKNSELPKISENQSTQLPPQEIFNKSDVNA